MENDLSELMLNDELVERINQLCPASLKDDFDYSGRNPPMWWPEWYFYGKFLYPEHWTGVLYQFERAGVDTAAIRADIAKYHAESEIGAGV